MKYKLFIATVLALALGLLTACSSAKMPADAISYDDIRGSGLANNCPALTGTNMDSIPVDAGQTYRIKALCLQPETFLVKDSPAVKRQAGKFVEGKLLTRSSFTLDQISGDLQVNANGELAFVEQGGFDFQPVTLQIPNGDRVPLLFTVKGLVASSEGAVSALSPSTRFAGNFEVPPYRPVSEYLQPHRSLRPVLGP